MKIGGRPLAEHIRLLAPLFILIAAIWALRLIADALGAPPRLVRIFSVTVTGSVCILLAVLLIYARRFAHYSNVVLAVFLLVCWEQLLIVAAIAASIFTARSNVFTEPQFSGPAPSPLLHIIGHLTFGIGIQTLFGAGMASLLFWLIRKLGPPTQQPGVGHKTKGLP